MRHLARTVSQMTLNDFVIQILADRMAKELMIDPTLFLRHIPDYLFEERWEYDWL